jgi:hypothetical protein
VAHACNPSYSADRDQEYHGLKPALESSSRDPISKKKKKKAGGVVQGVNPSTSKKKKKAKYDSLF